MCAGSSCVSQVAWGVHQPALLKCFSSILVVMGLFTPELPLVMQQ